MDFTKGEMHNLMIRCIDVARKSSEELFVNKPYIGAVVLSADKKIIGEGYKYFLNGTKSLVIHAERMALNQAAQSGYEGICLISTLEPCIRKYKGQMFSPCCELIVERGIKHVIFGLTDCSPTVNGGAGFLYLKNRNVSVQKYRNLNGIIESELMH